jgi:N6-adenosine-specific RNA methylase IME4
MNKGVRSLVVAPLGEHSKKPDEVRDRIVQLFGDPPRIELFARLRVQGWDAWGDQTRSDVDLVGDHFVAVPGLAEAPLASAVPGRQPDAR